MSSTAVKHRLSCTLGTSQRGFTLIEMLVTMTIMAILASIAIPSFSNQMARKRLNETTTTFVTAFRDAKAESLIQETDLNVAYNAGESILVTTATNGDVIGRASVSDGVAITVTMVGASADAITFTSDRTASSSVIKICDADGAITEGFLVTVSPTAVISTEGGVTCS